MIAIVASDRRYTEIIRLFIECDRMPLVERLVSRMADFEALCMFSSAVMLLTIISSFIILTNFFLFLPSILQVFGINDWNFLSIRSSNTCVDQTYLIHSNVRLKLSRLNCYCELDDSFKLAHSTG